MFWKKTQLLSLVINDKWNKPKTSLWKHINIILYGILDQECIK